MKIIFLGVACTPEALRDAESKFYNNVSQVRPQQYFDYKLVKGLAKENEVQALSIPPVSSFPNSRCIFYKRNDEQINSNLSIKYMTLINLPILKTLIIMLTSFCYLFFWLKKNKNTTIICGYLSLEVILPVILVSRLLNNKSVVVVPDLPHLSVSYSNEMTFIKRKLQMISLWLGNKFQNEFDGYILLSEYMNEVINKKNKPYLVIEGMVDLEEEVFPQVTDRDTQFIMYAGTLHEKFGIGKLIDAFLLANLSDIELWIYGQGDYTEEIKKIAAKTSRIKYMGSADKKTILKREKEAILLVNPRPSNEELTKYSFPSKTLEYMLSGTPLLTTKLLGMPSEYYSYVYTFDNEDLESMSKRLVEILLIPENENEFFGNLAREYILKNKSNKKQAQRIIEFVKILTIS